MNPRQRSPEEWDKEIREWNPEGIWHVKFWNRYKYIIVEVQAGSASLAETMAAGALRRDGEDPRTCTVVEVKRVE